MARKARPAAMHPTVVLEPKPPPEQVANISDCSITSDSVVATATVRTDSVMQRIVVQWGDGAITNLRNRPGIEAVGGPEQLPPGTYKLSHAYAEPEDRMTFSHHVIVRVEDSSGGVDFCVREIALTPRYRVTNYRTTLIFNVDSSCDSWFEAQNEFVIYQYVDGEPVQRWEWYPGGEEITPLEIPFLLSGSQVSRELTVEDGTVQVKLDIIEVDPLSNDYLYIGQSFSAMSDTDLVEDKATGQYANSVPCELKYRYDREVKLIVPLPSPGQEIVMMGG